MTPLFVFSKNPFPSPPSCPRKGNRHCFDQTDPFQPQLFGTPCFFPSTSSTLAPLPENQRALARFSRSGAREGGGAGEERTTNNYRTKQTQCACNHQESRNDAGLPAPRPTGKKGVMPRSRKRRPLTPQETGGARGRGKRPEGEDAGRGREHANPCSSKQTHFLCNHPESRNSIPFAARRTGDRRASGATPPRGARSSGRSPGEERRGRGKNTNPMFVQTDPFPFQHTGKTTQAAEPSHGVSGRTGSRRGGCGRGKAPGSVNPESKR